MTILLGLDLETTGLNPEEGSIIEIGAMLWDTNSRECLTSFSTLINDNGIIPPEIEAMTGITQNMVDLYGAPLDMAMRKIMLLINQASYAVAHNCEFEKTWLSLAGYEFTVPWIDTKTDLPFKPGKGSGSLSEIAMAHGLFNPRPHRALPDVHVMMQLLSQYDFAEVERYANSPEVTLAIKFDYDKTKVKNGKAKSLGYHWEDGPKWWERKCKDFQVQEAFEKAQAVGFTPRILEPETASR